MKIAIGWLVLTVVVVLSTWLASAVRTRAYRRRPLPLWPVFVLPLITLGPSFFTGWALAQFGIRLLGGN